MILLTSIAALRRGLRGRSRHVAGCFTICVALAASSPAFAQSNQRDVPLREGNIYDHQDHQPTVADVCPGEAARDPNCPSQATGREVEEEVNKLLQDTDIDLQSGERQLNDPGGDTVLPPRHGWL